MLKSFQIKNDGFSPRSSYFKLEFSKSIVTEADFFLNNMTIVGLVL